MSVIGKAWQAWKRVARRIAAFQFLILLTLIYFLILPFFTLYRLKDPLKTKLDEGADTYWEERPQEEATVERFSHPF